MGIINRTKRKLKIVEIGTYLIHKKSGEIGKVIDKGTSICTIQHAINLLPKGLKSNVTIYLEPGTYSDRVGKDMIIQSLYGNVIYMSSYSEVYKGWNIYNPPKIKKLLLDEFN